MRISASKPRMIWRAGIVAALLAVGGPAFAQSGPTSSANQCERAAVIAPNNSTDLSSGVTLGLFNGNATACNIQMTLWKNATGTSTTWVNVQAGAILPVRVKRVWEAATTCSNLLACY